jgi:hypothetical protein
MQERKSSVLEKFSNISKIILIVCQFCTKTGKPLDFCGALVYNKINGD